MKVEKELRTIRSLTNRIVEEPLDAKTTALLMMRIANANANAVDALGELRRIVET